MSQAAITGSCLCGHIRYAVKGHTGIFQYCHCSRCRKMTGSAHAANILVAPDDFEWLAGEDEVRHYIPDDSKHFTTTFCSKCGSTLPSLTKTHKSYIVPAGSLDDTPDIQPIQNIFYASKAPWYKEASSLPAYDELPPRKKK